MGRCTRATCNLRAMPAAGAIIEFALHPPRRPRQTFSRAPLLAGPGPCASVARLPGRCILRASTAGSPEAYAVSNDLYPVKINVRARSHICSLEEYQAMYRRSLEEPDEFWAEQAKAITWFHPWHTVFDADYEEIDFAWYS